jgi:tRNA threonylcarbamoyl adenosine modification protein (Sua5/YciO/YrdC/YwlC family)
MAQFFAVHPDNPQPRLIRQAARIVRDGGVIVYPTDSCYGLGCDIASKDAVERVRAIRGVDEDHLLSLVCRDLAEISRYARVDNRQYRILKSATPGPYTFILKASREVPRRLQRRDTIGLRIPDHRVAQSLLAELDEPLLSATLLLPQEELPLNDPQQIRERLEREVDAILAAGPCSAEMTTVVDLSGDAPRVVREGLGSAARLGL